MEKKFKFGYRTLLPVIASLFLAMVSCNKDEEKDEDVDLENTTGNNGSGVLKGHAYVDLGLPSGTKWATCNLGAAKAEDYGDYFAWGEVLAKPTYTPANLNSELNAECSVLQSKGIILQSKSGVTGQDVGVLTSDYDAATAAWGPDWMLPTVDQMEELYRCCTNKWTELNGVKGRLFTSSNGEMLFLPAAGHKNLNRLEREKEQGTYWTATAYDNNWGACNVFFTSEKISWSQNFYRYDGQSIRPVLRSK